MRHRMGRMRRPISSGKGSMNEKDDWLVRICAQFELAMKLETNAALEAITLIRNELAEMIRQADSTLGNMPLDLR